MATPLDICEQRDVKGLYKKARAGQIKGTVTITTSNKTNKKKVSVKRNDNEKIVYTLKINLVFLDKAQLADLDDEIHQFSILQIAFDAEYRAVIYTSSSISS